MLETIFEMFPMDTVVGMHFCGRSRMTPRCFPIWWAVHSWEWDFDFDFIGPDVGHETGHRWRHGGLRGSAEPFVVWFYFKWKAHTKATRKKKQVERDVDDDKVSNSKWLLVISGRNTSSWQLGHTDVRTAAPWIFFWAESAFSNTQTDHCVIAPVLDRFAEPCRIFELRLWVKRESERKRQRSVLIIDLIRSSHLVPTGWAPPAHYRHAPKIHRSAVSTLHHSSSPAPNFPELKVKTWIIVCVFSRFAFVSQSAVIGTSATAAPFGPCSMELKFDSSFSSFGWQRNEIHWTGNQPNTVAPTPHRNAFDVGDVPTKQRNNKLFSPSSDWMSIELNELANWVSVALLTDPVEWISHQMDPIQQSRQMIEKIHFRVNQQEAADPTDCRSH